MISFRDSQLSDIYKNPGTPTYKVSFTGPRRAPFIPGHLPLQQRAPLQVKGFVEVFPSLVPRVSSVASCPLLDSQLLPPPNSAYTWVLQHAPGASLDFRQVPSQLLGSLASTASQALQPQEWPWDWEFAVVLSFPRVGP